MKLPKQLNVFDFASKNLKFSREFQIKELLEISKFAKNKTDKIATSLSFFLEDESIPCVKGFISTIIVSQCQRCLEDISLDLNIEFNIGFIKNHTKNININPIFELYIIEEENILTIDFISEEILLAMPMAPTHKYNCYEYKKLYEKIEKNTKKPFVEALKNIKILN